MTPEESRAFLRALPGYPFMPCKICASEGFSSASCEHSGWERARAWHPGLIGEASSDQSLHRPDALRTGEEVRRAR